MGFANVPSVVGSGALDITLSSGYPSGAALVFFAFEATSVPLPQFGAGCSLLLSAPMLGGALVLGGSASAMPGGATFSYLLPAGPTASAFHGLAVHAQAVSTDGVGLKFSNRGEFRIGL
jgi:hypothetical protein